MWSTGDIQKMFGVSPQTVRNWTKEFKNFLSDGAAPTQAGYTRRFNADDLLVFALVSEMTGLGAAYPEVRAALMTGKRGDLPEAPKQDDGPIALLRPEEIARTMALIKERDEALGRIEQLLLERDHDRRVVAAKDNEINRLNREIGRLEAQLESARKAKKENESE